MNKEIVPVGRRYKCIKTVYMNGNQNDVRFIEGKVYRSEVEGCITDETGLKEHYWFNPSEAFVLLSNKRKRHGRKERR